jgi:hypothetical protein
MPFITSPLHKWLVLRLTLKSNRDVLISVLEVLLCLEQSFFERMRLVLSIGIEYKKVVFITFFFLLL